MPSKQRKSGDEDMAQERAPVQQSTENAEIVDTSDINDEPSMDTLPISIAPEWNDIYEDPMTFEESVEEQYSKSPFFGKNDEDLFVRLLERYSYCSISEYFDDEQTVKNADTEAIINFLSYAKISFSTELASIYHVVIQLLQSLNNSDDIIYPWSLIYPQNKETQLPIISANGSYFVKLFFCGKWRAILIDDNVPIFDDKLLFPIADTNEIWPQLLTKAILKFLILSNRLNDHLHIALIIQLLTSTIPTAVSQINGLSDSGIHYKYICNLDEERNIANPIVLDDIQDWSMTTALNNFVISDDIIENEKCWAIVDCTNHHIQTADDLWENRKIFTNDKTVFISEESKEMEIVLQITSLSTNISEKVGLFIYDEANNIKKSIEMIDMKHGFVCLVPRIKPKEIYIIEVDGNISYSVSLYAPSSNVYLCSRFGNEDVWNIAGYKMIQIVSECKNHQISQTFVLFNIHIEVMSDECHILFHSVFNDAQLSNSLLLYCVDLDDYCMKLIPNLNLSTLNIQQNKSGYSLIAFSRPTQVIRNSKYEIKLQYKGDIEYHNIDMDSCLDFEINYIQNVDVQFMKDEIISNDAAKCMFCQVYFETNDSNYGDFGKIIEFIDKDTNDTVATYRSTQSVVYVPQILIRDSQLWFVIKLDKSNVGTNENRLFEDNSVQCRVRIISDAKIRLFPDNSQQIKFDEIKQTWQISKGRAEKAFQTRQNYLQKQDEKPHDQAKATDVEFKQTHNQQSIVVTQDFWLEHGENKKQLLGECNEKIENEQQFRVNQSTQMTDHSTYIQTSQIESFKNIQTFTNDDSQKRGELRCERLEWNQQLSAIYTRYDEMKQDFEDFKETLSKYDGEVQQMVESIENTESAKKGKSKSKISKPTINIILRSNMARVMEECQNIEETVPQWLFGNKINEYNVNMCSILYHVYAQINTQFAQLIDDKIKMKKLEDDAIDSFEECCEKYINLCATMFEQVDTITKWHKCQVWRAKLQDVQNECDGIMVESVFSKLQSLIPMDTIEVNQDDSTQNDEANPISTIAKEYLNEIKFASDSRSDIMIKNRCIPLNESYAQYIIKIEQCIQQKEKEHSMESVPQSK